ncbi:Protein of unknown function [Gryllus bimaculatus]|nr:Protein of unknown function [Gryllus bimaculatus]
MMRNQKDTPGVSKTTQGRVARRRRGALAAAPAGGRHPTHRPQPYPRAAGGGPRPRGHPVRRRAARAAALPSFTPAPYAFLAPSAPGLCVSMNLDAGTLHVAL